MTSRDALNKHCKMGKRIFSLNEDSLSRKQHCDIFPLIRSTYKVSMVSIRVKVLFEFASFSSSRQLPQP